MSLEKLMKIIHQQTELTIRTVFESGRRDSREKLMQIIRKLQEHME